MASDKELADFLASVERRAFKQTIYAVRDHEASLDCVQDAMIRLAEKYGDKPAPNFLCCFSVFYKTSSSIISAAKKSVIPGLAFFPRSPPSNED